MNETTICPACACNTLHSYEYAGHSLKCYDCYSCDYHKEEKVVKHIPVYIELKDVPSEDIELINVRWIDIKGINTPFYQVTQNIKKEEI